MHDEYIEAGYEHELGCDSCFPGVHRYNKATYLVHAECSDQFIVGMSGATTLNSLAINAVMDDYGIVDGTDRIEVRRDVSLLANTVLEIRKAQQKAKK